MDESVRRIADLATSTRGAEHLLQDLGALFRSEEQRIISAFFDTTHRTFVGSATSAVAVAVRRSVDALASTCRAGALRQAAYHAARGIVAHHVKGWLKDIEPQAEALYRQATQRFVTVASDFLHSLAALGDPSFEGLPRALDPETGFRAAPHFFFTDLMSLTGVSPIDWWLDRIRGRSASGEAVSRDAIRYADRLLTTNSSRAIFDLRERLADSRAACESELRTMLTDVSASARRALDRARELRKTGDQAVARQLKQLEAYRTRLRDVLEERAVRDDAHA
jgi:hypothetical protein